MNAAIDPKIIDKINKLMNLAKDGGATEAEAELAMEKAREIMAANNLTMATMEAAGKRGADGATRKKGELKGKAAYNYQQTLMRTCAAVNFCHVRVTDTWTGKRWRTDGYALIGREANVIAALNMFDYLNQTLERLVTPHIASNAQRLSRWAISFKEGAANRLATRLRDRHEEEMAEQSRQAREQQAAARHPGASSAGNAVVVVMEDYEQAERDANAEFQNGWEPGTAAKMRAEREARVAEAARVEAERRAGLTEEERRREDAAREKDYKRWERASKARSNAYWKNKDMDAYWEGSAAADKVGLDTQIDRQTQKSIG